MRLIAGIVLLFLLYTRISDVGITFHGLPSIAQPYVLVLAAATFFRRTRTGGARSLRAYAGLWGAMALYAAVLAASAAWAPDAGAAIKQVTDLLKNLLITYVVVETFDTPRALRLAIWSLLAAGALLAGLTVVQALTHGYANTFGGLAQAPVREITIGANSYRSSGPIGDPNFYGLILVVLLPMALLRARDEARRDVRLAAIGVALLLATALVLTYSRGGALTLGAVLLLYVPLARVRPAQVAVALAIAIPVAAAVVPASFWQRIAILGSAVDVTGVRSDQSLRGRAGAAEVALDIFADHPLTGVGGGNYPDVFFPYALRLNVPSAANYTHDVYLQVAAETGLPGLVTFGAVLILALQAAWSGRQEARLARDRAAEGLAASCLLALGAYMIGVAMLPAAYPRYLWILIGLAMAAGLCAPTGRLSSANSATSGEAA